MAAIPSIIAAKDGAGALIPGGLRTLDLSGTGAGPHAVGHVLLDASGTPISALALLNGGTVVGTGNRLPVDAGAVALSAGTADIGTVHVAGGGTIAVTPRALTSANLSGTIAATGTFQSIQTLNAGRLGGLIQNNSTANAMSLYIGAIGGADATKSFTLQPGAALSLNINSGVLTDQVNIAGTAGDPFFANFQ